MSLCREIETKFDGKAFQRPLFYAYPQGLRFELSEGGSAIEQFLCALRKALAICSDIFDLNGTLVVCIRFWSNASLFACRAVIAELHSAGIEFPQKRCVWSEPVEDKSFADATSPARWVNIAFEIPTTLLQNLLWCALATDFGNIRPRPGCLVYLIDLKKEILVFPYDDRGMDVVGPNKALLSTLYVKHTHDLLDYVRPQWIQSLQLIPGKMVQILFHPEVDFKLRKRI